MSAMLPTPSRASEPAGAGTAVALTRDQAEPGAAQGAPERSFDAVMETVTARKESARGGAKATVVARGKTGGEESSSPVGKPSRSQKGDPSPRTSHTGQGSRRAAGRLATDADGGKAVVKAGPTPAVAQSSGGADEPPVDAQPGGVEVAASGMGATGATGAGISSNPMEAAPAATRNDLMGAVMAPAAVERPAVVTAAGLTRRSAGGSAPALGMAGAAVEMRASVLEPATVAPATPTVRTNTLEGAMAQGPSTSGNAMGEGEEPPGGALADGLKPGLQTAGVQMAQGAGGGSPIIERGEFGGAQSSSPQAVTGPAQPDGNAGVIKLADLTLGTAALAQGTADSLPPILVGGEAGATASEGNASSPAQPAGTAAPQVAGFEAVGITARVAPTSARELLVNQAIGNAAPASAVPPKSEQPVAPDRTVSDKNAGGDHDAVGTTSAPAENSFSVPSTPKQTVSESRAFSAPDTWPRETDSLSAGKAGVGGGGTTEATGTGGAKSSPWMRKTEENDGVVPNTGHFLPGAAALAEDSASGSGLRTAPRANLVAAESDLSRFSSPVPAELAGSNVPLATLSTDGSHGSELVRGRSSIELGTVQSQISNWAVDIKRSGSASMEVVLRPNEQTEVALRLSMQDGSVVVAAECKRGDWETLGEHWGQLQESLSEQGIRLGALEPANALELLGQSSTGGFNSFNRPGAGLPEYAEASGPKPVFSSAVSNPQRSTARQVPVAAGRWESWA